MLLLTLSFFILEFKRLSSVGDLGTTQDVSSLVSYLVTPEARFITGVYITRGQGFVTDGCNALLCRPNRKHILTRTEGRGLI